MQYPNILVVTESPLSSTQGFGVTLATLLEGWPKDSFFALYRSRRFEDKKTTSIQYAQSRMVYANLPENPLLQILPYVFGNAPLCLGHYSTAWIKKMLKDWRPDVVYSWYYSRSVPKYGDWLARYFKCPHIVHVGDDSPEKKRKDENIIKDIYRKAAKRLAISHEMKEELERRYHCDFEVLHNGAADNLFEDEKPVREKDGTLIIRYIGSLLRAQHWHSIEDVVEAVKVFNNDNGRAKFEIYCDDWTKKRAMELVDGKNIVYCGFAPKPENYTLMKTADILLLPITFSEEKLKWFRFSFQTKLPEYLASGTPTLVYGPCGTAPVEFCIRNNIALVYSKRSVSDLVTLFSDIQNDKDSYQQRALSDRAFAKKYVSASAMRTKFRELIGAH